MTFWCLIVSKFRSRIILRFLLKVMVLISLIRLKIRIYHYMISNCLSLGIFDMNSFLVSSFRFQVFYTELHRVFLIWILLKEAHRDVSLVYFTFKTSDTQLPSSNFHKFNQTSHQNVPSICLGLSLLVR